jgi:hypothetical protein
MYTFHGVVVQGQTDMRKTIIQRRPLCKYVIYTERLYPFIGMLFQRLVEGKHFWLTPKHDTLAGKPCLSISGKLVAIFLW